ncbi:cathelicidin-related antimicrobial peptide Bf-CRAMP-like [Phascolarctos cinereus]|uniref:Cathelicidin-related peptide Bf-CRAMP-like n=1 Tax=Phascolarctos cinereus TaxID=38626 RepID=A0A6P5L9L7_PHACI|nr:cathelicidin-related peptide Bf-CRAMP-like [Phascolarctos cinereus]
MEHLRKALLLASVATLIPTQAFPLSSLSYEQALSTAIHFYNEVHRGENAFRLLQTYSPSSNKDPQEQTLKRVNFTLKETVCPMTEDLVLYQCDFKTDGLVKECQGSLSNEQGIAAIILTCDPVAPEPSRFRRALFPRRRKGSNKPGKYSVLFAAKPSVGKTPHILTI